MADNIPITAGSGTNVATDERSIGGSTVHVQRVMETGGAAWAVGVASVTTTSASAIAARETRKYATVLALPANNGNIDIGPSGVASGSGFPLVPGAATDVATTAAIHADASTGTQSLAYEEFYD
jgi:hypothetical protein